MFTEKSIFGKSGVNDLFKSFFDDEFFKETFAYLSSNTTGNFSEKLEADESQVSIILSLPGHNKGTISVNINNNVLEIKTLDSDFKYAPKFHKKWKVNTDVYDLSSITAKCEYGILVVTMQKFRAKPATGTKVSVPIS